ncbi:MAG TPA: hypothetical protein VLK57_14355 [Pseudonocardia sp.]|nr:hypothetical protein [Pseudonocardia sp.]
MSDDGPARASAPPNDDQPLRVAMKKVATALKGANVPFALSGGYASWARGGPEPSHDVDFVLLADDVPHALQVLDAAGLRVVEPPEDWLVKVYDGDALVDLIFRPAERPVTREQLDAANEVRVDSVVMPVQSATDLLAAKLLVLNEHYCDFARLFPHIRALREQVDWPALHEVVGHSPFARSFLALCGELGIAES